MDGDDSRNGLGGDARKEPPRPSADEVEDGPGGGLFQRLFGMLSRPATVGEIAEAIDKGEAGAARDLPKPRREMIERVMRLDERRVEDVMAPRADIIAVDVATPLRALVAAFVEAGHSRLPVYRGDLDEALGMAHIKDVLALLARPEGAPPPDAPVLGKLVRDVLYVPPSMRVMDLLVRMQASRIHMALVIDEYGGTDGLVTIEDLVEEIVGEINDEHDDLESPTILTRAGGWEADARVELADFEARTGVKLSAEDEDVDTLGGLVLSLAGGVPQKGDVVSHPVGLDFEVTEGDGRKIRRLRVRRRPDFAARQSEAS